MLDSSIIIVIATVATMAFLVLVFFWSLCRAPQLTQELSGWNMMMQKYPLRTKYDGSWIKSITTHPPLGSGKPGFVSPIELALTPSSLYIQWPPNIFEIPLHCILSVEERRRFWDTYYLFVIKDAPLLTVSRTEELAQYLLNNKVRLPLVKLNASSS